MSRIANAGARTSAGDRDARTLHTRMHVVINVITAEKMHHGGARVCVCTGSQRDVCNVVCTVPMGF